MRSRRPVGPVRPAEGRRVVAHRTYPRVRLSVRSSLFFRPFQIFRSVGRRSRSAPSSPCGRSVSEHCASPASACCEPALLVLGPSPRPPIAPNKPSILWPAARFQLSCLLSLSLLLARAASPVLFPPTRTLKPSVIHSPQAATVAPCIRSTGLERPLSPPIQQRKGFINA